MGTNYYVVDEHRKIVLEVGKYPALAQAAGMAHDEHVVPVTPEHVEASKAGWAMDWRSFRDGDERGIEMMDAEWSTQLALPVARWMREVAEGRPLMLYRETVTPWGDELGYPTPDSGWTLFTLYVHPLTNEATPPWALFPATG